MAVVVGMLLGFGVEYAAASALVLEVSFEIALAARLLLTPMM